VDCELYAKLGCKVSEFHILPLQMPPPCTLHSAARSGCPPFASPFLPSLVFSVSEFDDDDVDHVDR